MLLREQGEIDLTPIHRGIRVLINAEMEDGNFTQKLNAMSSQIFLITVLELPRQPISRPIWGSGSIVVESCLHNHEWQYVSSLDRIINELISFLMYEQIK